MISRISNRLVTFQRPFILDGMDEIQPAGIYSVDTEEEAVIQPLATEDVSWQIVGTSIRLVRHGQTDYLAIDSERLEQALERDSAQSDADEIKRLSITRREIARKLNSFSLRIWK